MDWILAGIIVMAAAAWLALHRPSRRHAMDAGWHGDKPELTYSKGIIKGGQGG